MSSSVSWIQSARVRRGPGTYYYFGQTDGGDRVSVFLTPEVMRKLVTPNVSLVVVTRAGSDPLRLGVVRLAKAWQGVVFDDPLRST